MKIFIDKEKIILRKYEPACIFWGSADKGRIICKKYINTINEIELIPGELTGRKPDNSWNNC